MMVGFDGNVRVCGGCGRCCSQVSRLVMSKRVCATRVFSKTWPTWS